MKVLDLKNDEAIQVTPADLVDFIQNNTAKHSYEQVLSSVSSEFENFVNNFPIDYLWDARLKLMNDVDIEWEDPDGMSGGGMHANVVMVQLHVWERGLTAEKRKQMEAEGQAPSVFRYGFFLVLSFENEIYQVVAMNSPDLPPPGQPDLH